MVAVGADKPTGALPLHVALSSAGTNDPDDDDISYAWTITSPRGTVLKRFSEANPSYTFTKAGVYGATLTVTDSAGARSSAKLSIAAGNEPPKVDITVADANQTFFFPAVPIRYAVSVNDREDGALPGRIPASRVMVSADFMKDGLLPGLAGAAKPSTDAPSTYAEGKRLIETGDCLSCHKMDRMSIGPAYTAVARKYRNDSTATAHLIRKIRGGGTGVWGKVMMPAHPQLTDAEAAQVVGYILSLGAPKKASLPVRGSYVPTAGSATAPKGVLILRAAYTDRGANGLPGVRAEKAVVLRAPTIAVSSAELSEGLSRQGAPGMPVELTVVSRPGASAKFKRLDLSGVAAVTVTALAPTPYKALGGIVELHVDSATGPVIGTSAPITPVADTAAPPSALRVAVQPTSGVHDLYLVAKNADAKGDALLFVLLTATFEPAPMTEARTGTR